MPALTHGRLGPHGNGFGPIPMKFQQPCCDKNAWKNKIMGNVTRPTALVGGIGHRSSIRRVWAKRARTTNDPIPGGQNTI